MNLENKDLGQFNNPEVNSPTFPSYDNYSLNAQGLSGSISSKFHENGSLFGLSDMINDDDYTLKYAIDGATSANEIPDYAKFDQMPIFYIDNEISNCN